MRALDGLIDLRPLRATPAFRRLWVGNTLSGIGGQLTLVAVLYQAWTVTDSAVAVGLVGLTQAIPMVIFGLVGGSLADSVDRRRLVLGTTVGQTVVAGLLAAQAVAGLDSFAILLVLVAAQAACLGLGAPARRTFPVRLLAGDQLAAGLALNQLGFQVAMLVGPAVAGVIIAGAGVQACYLVDAVTFVAAGYGVLRLPSMRPLGTASQPGLAAIWSSWRLIGRLPALRGALVVDVFATVLAMPVALFPVVNDERFGGDPETLGLFFSAVAVGGVVAGAASGFATRTPRPGRIMLVAAGFWGVGLAGFGLAHQLWLALGCLAIAGAADMVSVVSRATIVQLATPDSHRGRVSAVEHIIGVSGPDLGNFRAGLAAGATTPSVALVSGGLLCVAGVTAIAIANRPLRRFTVSDREPEPEPAV
jgi:MFS family permease